MANWLDYLAGSISPAYLLGWGISELTAKKSPSDLFGLIDKSSNPYADILSALEKMGKPPAGISQLTPEEQRAINRQRDLALLNVASNQALAGEGGTGIAQAQKQDIYNKTAELITNAGLAKTKDLRDAWLAELQKSMAEGQMKLGQAQFDQDQTNQWLAILGDVAKIAGQVLPYLL